MSNYNISNHITEIIKLAYQAGEAIMHIYNNGDFGIDSKADNSPLTEADRASHLILSAGLEAMGLPVLSEEGKNIAHAERAAWPAYWLIDPLDGTKEFIKKNGEFTINIALIENQKPTWGLVFAPALDKMYFVNEKKQVILKQQHNQQVLHARVEPLRLDKAQIRVVASRSHLDEKTQNLLNSLNNPEIVSMGSSLKFMMLAEGLADVYPRYAPTMEWDTAAAHAIMNHLGYKVYKENESVELEYNKLNLLNPGFLVQ